MTSATYEVTLRDRYGKRIGILPPYGQTPVDFIRTLSAAGSATITPRLTLPLISGKANRRRLTAWGSEISIVRLSGPGRLGLVWEGPVTKSHADVDADTLSVTAVTPWGWLATERTIQDTHAYGGWDQLDVARDLITQYTTGLGPNGDIRMSCAAGKSGVTVTELYQATDNKTAGQAVQDLAAATNGFDFDVISTLDPHTNRTSRIWTPYSPTKGAKVTQVLRIGRGGLRNFTLEDATQIATRVTGTGQITFSAQAAQNVEDQYGIHTASISLTESNSLSLLQRQVLNYLKYRTPPVDIVTFSYKVSAQTPYRFIDIGDTVRVVSNRGWAAYDDWVRIVSDETAVDVSGAETVTCTAFGVPGGIS